MYKLCLYILYAYVCKYVLLLSCPLYPSDRCVNDTCDVRDGCIRWTPKWNKNERRREDTISHWSRPLNSTSLRTMSMTRSAVSRVSVLPTAGPRPGLSILVANTSSSIMRSREARTPIRAQPRSRSQPSTMRPRPMVSSLIGPANRRRENALKAVLDFIRPDYNCIWGVFSKYEDTHG